MVNIPLFYCFVDAVHCFVIGIFKMDLNNPSVAHKRCFLKCGFSFISRVGQKKKT